MSTPGEAVAPAKRCSHEIVKWACCGTVIERCKCPYEGKVRWVDGFCGPCEEKHVAASPSPAQTSGEGRGLKFVEACEAVMAGEDVEWQYPGSELGWSPFTTAVTLNPTEIAKADEAWRFRLKSKPAHTPGRCAEAVKEYCRDKGFIDDGGMHRHISAVAESMLREAAQWIRETPRGYRDHDGHVADDLLTRFLGGEAKPGGRG